MKLGERNITLNRNYETTNEISVQVDSDRLDSSIDKGYLIACTKTVQKLKAIRQKCFSINSDITFPDPKKPKSVKKNDNGRIKSEVFPSRMHTKLRKISRSRVKSVLTNKISISSKTKNIRYNSEYQNIKTPKFFSKVPSKVSLACENLIDITLKSNYRSPIVKLDRGCEYKRMSNTPFKQVYYREPLTKINVLDSLVPSIKAIGKYKIV